MSSLDLDDIRRLSQEAYRFSRIANWQWKGRPTMEWEFTTIKDFARARMELMQALKDEMSCRATSDWTRTLDPETFEIDYHGITFRLICRQRIATQEGAKVGATEIIYTSLDDYEERIRREIERKLGGKKP